MTASHTFGIRYAPMLAFIGVYLLTCFVGAALLIVENEVFAKLLHYFTGTVPPELTTEQLTTNLILLLIAPTLTLIAYATVLDQPFPRRAIDRIRRLIPAVLSIVSPQVAFVAFVCCVVAALLRLQNAVVLGDVDSWLNYSDLVENRYAIFSRLQFFDFVNIYVLVPLGAACMLLSHSSRSQLPKIVLWPLLSIAIVLQLFLFQKKAVLVAFLIVICAVSFYFYHRPGRGYLVKRLLVFGAATSVAIYVLLTLIPVYSEIARTASQSKRTAMEEQALIEIAKEFELGEQKKVLFFYVAMAPLTRTSAPALWYPVIFPEAHPFYGLDIGQDILGFGSMPDDNKVVWTHMNKELPGASAAPFQFVLYSQGGLPAALIGSLLIGAALGFCWKLLLVANLPLVYASLFASMTFLFSVYLAIDSVRNSILASYGVIWGIGFIILLALFSSVFTAPQLEQANSG